MPTKGWGLISTLVTPDRPAWYRWDQPGSSTYWLRPDHTIEAYIAGRKGMRSVMPDIASLALSVMPGSSEVKVNREIGAPSIPTPASTIPSKRRQGRAPAEHGKHGGPRRESGRGGRARRKSCPKGHYWSYKLKKCVKSKYR